MTIKLVCSSSWTLATTSLCFVICFLPGVRRHLCASPREQCHEPPSWGPILPTVGSDSRGELEENRPELAVTEGNSSTQEAGAGETI